ncbi:ABC-three component system middle component 6 [Entomospira nematocerorum]|uniref:ABC-three component system middle component 6 n=1 Tax=Entomospira nematocerorum TaxID=2719987 RepID=UPI0039C90E5B
MLYSHTIEKSYQMEYNRTMIIEPTLSPYQSLYYIGAMLLTIMKERESQYLFELYEEYQRRYAKEPMPYKKFILAIDYLYILNKVKLVDGKLRLC